MLIQCDGACNGNPGGPMGIGAVFFADDGSVVHELSEAIGNGTNNIAEYTCVKRALEVCVERNIRAPRVETDSDLVVAQVNGEANCYASHLLPLRDEVRRLLRQVGGTLTWISRRANGHADRLSKRPISMVILTDEVRAQVRAILAARNVEIPAIPERVRALLELATHAENDTLADALLDMQPGRDAFSAFKGAELRRVAASRHGEAAIAALENALAERSEKTRTTATRWACRGLPVAIALAKVNLDKAARAPFTMRHGPREA
jgi:ribonuclease HI